MDEAVFARTASLFAVKRQVFAPEAVQALASDIVRRLSTTSHLNARIDDSKISEVEIAAFCDVLIESDPSSALKFIAARRLEGVTRQGVYLGYVCAAARMLGQRWDEDRLSLFEVTTGTGHLYALMRAMRAGGPTVSLKLDVDRSALFATVPGEDHGIGITVAADLFRDQGWHIDLQTDTSHDSLMARVERTQPTIIGLSLSTENRLDALVRLVVAMRLAVPHAIIGVAPGSDLDGSVVLKLVDIDLLFDDARTAFTELDRLIRLRS